MLLRVVAAGALGGGKNGRERNVTTLLKRQRWVHLKKIVPSQQMGIKWSDESTDCVPQCTSPRAKDNAADNENNDAYSDTRSVQSALHEDTFDDTVPASAGSL